MSDFGYLQDLDAPNDTSKIGPRLPFQFQPDGMQDSHESGFHSVLVPGHSHGLTQFGGGGTDDNPIQLAFVGDTSDPAYVADRVAWLLSLTYPDYDSSGRLVRPPHTVLYVVGDWINERCKVISVKASYGKTFHQGTRYPRTAVVDVLLRRFSDQALDYTAVRP